MPRSFRGSFPAARVPQRGEQTRVRPLIAIVDQ